MGQVLGQTRAVHRCAVVGQHFIFPTKVWAQALFSVPPEKDKNWRSSAQCEVPERTQLILISQTY